MNRRGIGLLVVSILLCAPQSWAQDAYSYSHSGMPEEEPALTELLPSPANTQPTPPPEPIVNQPSDAPPSTANYTAQSDPQAPVTSGNKNGSLADFDRVDFFCRSDSGRDYTVESICMVARNTTMSGASELGLRYGDDPTLNSENGFVLLVRITSSGKVPRAISAMIQASRYYDQAVDLKAPHASAAAVSRRGKLVMYEEIITGVGQGDGLENAMRVSVRRVIQGLFARIRQDKKDSR